MGSDTQAQERVRASAGEANPGFVLLRGVLRLGFDSVEHMTSLVEAMHHNIARAPLPFTKLDEVPAPGITGLVYRSVRGVTSLLRGGLDSMLGLAQPLLPAAANTSAHEAWRAAINGVLGDHLADSGNALAIPMRFRHQGRSLELERTSLAAALPHASGKLMVVIHGLCMNDLQWARNGHDHAEALARDLGYTPVYLHYNSGRHISTNGRELAGLLQNLVEQWPVGLESLTLLTHSMGGLLARSACHYAQRANHGWPSLLRNIVFLGTPHHGAPLERHGQKLHLFFGISPYISPLGRLGMIRSAGVTDLRFGNLLDDDWQHADRFAPTDDPRCIVPLPTGVEVFAAAASLGLQARDRRDRWLADGLVPVYSALGDHRDPARNLGIPHTRQWVGHAMSHWDLLDNAALYAQLRSWLGPAQAR
jgi:hypothetical protein